MHIHCLYDNNMEAVIITIIKVMMTTTSLHFENITNSHCNSLIFKTSYLRYNQESAMHDNHLQEVCWISCTSPHFA